MLRIRRAVSLFSVCLYGKDKNNCTLFSPVLMLWNQYQRNFPKHYSPAPIQENYLQWAAAIAIWSSFLSNNDPVCMALFMTLQRAFFLYIYCSVHHNILRNNQQMQLYAVNFISLHSSLYTFRAAHTPIIRSTKFNCIYSHWYTGTQWLYQWL